MEQNQLEVGKWVKGNNRDGAMFHGFIDHVEPFLNKVFVRVVNSDHEEIIGKTISMHESKVTSIEPVTNYSKGAILDLIDVALLIKDEKWFAELSSQLEAITKKGNADSSVKKTVSGNGRDTIGRI
ncbi:hypothetical protein [Bacillus dakarensis]|uniref:hypothetical protein n=1 Tax=Robertmurraya dakarensis TaxID=1926278 RepID=UPI000981AA74|nr:hypothetical protein [Bacillus dakarensis]